MPENLFRSSWPEQPSWSEDRIPFYNPFKLENFRIKTRVTMKDRKGVWAQIIFILFIGLVVSGIADRELLDSLRIIWQKNDPEVLLEYLSLGLGFLSLVLFLVWMVIRGIQGE